MQVVRDVRNNLWLVNGDRYKLMRGDWDAVINPMLVAWAKAGLIKTDEQGRPFVGLMEDVGWNSKFLFDVSG